MKRRAQHGPKRKRGRKEIIPSDVRWKLRERYLARYRQWGPGVLSDWAKREGLGMYSAGAIARVIDDLRLPKPAKKKSDQSGNLHLFHQHGDNQYGHQRDGKLGQRIKRKK